MGKMNLNKINSKKLVLSGLFIAIGLVLPSITMQITSIGNMLCPMHIPVILAGFICGAPYGLAVGFIVPLLRSITFGAPPLMPIATAMAFELATYGLVSGIVYNRVKDKKIGVYISLITAMILGRAVWGVVSYGLFTALGNQFTWQIFMMQAFVNAIPGIIIQLVFIPILVIKIKESEARRISYGR